MLYSPETLSVSKLSQQEFGQFKRLKEFKEILDLQGINFKKGSKFHFVSPGSVNQSLEFASYYFQDQLFNKFLEETKWQFYLSDLEYFLSLAQNGCELCSPTKKLKNYFPLSILDLKRVPRSVYLKTVGLQLKQIAKQSENTLVCVRDAEVGGVPGLFKLISEYIGFKYQGREFEIPQLIKLDQALQNRSYKDKILQRWCVYEWLRRRTIGLEGYLHSPSIPFKIDRGEYLNHKINAIQLEKETNFISHLSKFQLEEVLREENCQAQIQLKKELNKIKEYETSQVALQSLVQNYQEGKEKLEQMIAPRSEQ